MQKHARATLDLLKNMYPLGIEFQSEHDACDHPTARFDITVSFSNPLLIPWSVSNPSTPGIPEMLIMSLRYHGIEQFAHTRADLLPCVRKGIEFAARGLLDDGPPSIFTGLQPETDHCSVDYGVTESTFHLLKELHVRTHPAPPVEAPSWPVCHAWYTSNQFFANRTIDFLADPQIR